MVDVLSPDSERDFDFSGDSAVEIVTSTWQITEAEEEETESDNGSGVRHIITFQSDDFPYPVILRQFVEYTPTERGKNTDWVKRSRGILKNVAKAALGRPGYRLSELVGKRVQATTRDGGDGFATLTRFKSLKDDE